ncbi:MAG: sulfate adenylyltransferase subunit CysD [Deltaproteobacteria bacterium]
MTTSATGLDKNHLSAFENESIYLIREAFYQLRDVAMLWSIGKDSTTLLWLMRKAFYGKIPFPVLHIDTGFKFKEIYRFRDEYARRWNLDLIVHRNEDAIAQKVGPEDLKLKCCMELKTNALKQAIQEHGFKGLFLGIRRDEHGIRAKERFISPRDEDFEWNYKDQPPELWNQYMTGVKEEEHVRIHPLLSWREIDIWRYIEREGIPFVSLYLSKEGRRYRSIGCETCCSPVASDADSVERITQELSTSNVSERSGRAQDKESAYIMQKLRSLGYM